MQDRLHLDLAVLKTNLHISQLPGRAALVSTSSQSSLSMFSPCPTISLLFLFSDEGTSGAFSTYTVHKLWNMFIIKKAHLVIITYSLVSIIFCFCCFGLPLLTILSLRVLTISNHLVALPLQNFWSIFNLYSS